MPSRNSSPLVSLLLLTYNQQKFVEEAVRSALLQTYQPLEIIVSDDASTDRTFEIARRVIEEYRGPHLVTVSVNDRNVGTNGHLNMAVRRARGEFIVVAAGDDVSLPGRVERLVEHWRSGASGVFSNATIIDAQGSTKDIFVRQGYKHMAGWREMVLAGTHGAWGCTLSWEKKVFEVFGDMPENIMGEDAVIPFRCGLLNGLSYIDEPLVDYRDHGGNISFWAEERRLSRNELVELGSRIMQFKVQMYGNWKKDTGLARDRNIIDTRQHDWAQLVLDENILLVRKMDDLLKTSLVRLIFLLPYAWLYFARRMCGAVSRFVALKTTGWKLLNGVLHYRAPGTHQLIRRVFGRNI
ncbi:MAG TPA: glycosyltransferase [Burkholderiales bacterium]|nr:glycosyltransferase [Burkholderiales bacterium]